MRVEIVKYYGGKSLDLPPEAYGNVFSKSVIL